MADCAVCLQRFNLSTRLRVECATCSMAFCRTCLQNYALTQSSEPFRCMGAPACSAQWDREFLDRHSTASFRAHSYKAHREKSLKDREQARLPATQEDAFAYKDALRIVSEGRDEMARIKTEQEILYAKNYQAERRIAVAKDIITTMGRLRMPEGNTLTYGSNAVAPKKERSAFVKPCPAPSCKGFLSTAWKCGLCETWSCAECHDWKGESKEKDTPHTCDPGKVATAHLLAREAKSCPKCGVSICKIEGCDQMFCTSCNTGFNWRTGRIAEGAVHNPHYFEWLQRTGRTAATAATHVQVPMSHADPTTLCGIELDRAITRALETPRVRNRPRDELTGASAEAFLLASDDLDRITGCQATGDARKTQADEAYVKALRLQMANKYLLEAWRIMREEEDNDRREDSVEEIFRTLRVKYLCDVYTAESWPVALQRAEKNAAVRQTKADLRAVYIAGARDLIRQVLTPGADTAAIRKQVEELVAYCNTCRENASKRFNRIMPPLRIDRTYNRPVREPNRRLVEGQTVATVATTVASNTVGTAGTAGTAGTTQSANALPS
jgi:hypothetical protein